MEKTVLDDTEQCQQQNTYFIRNVLAGIINNSLSNLEKSKDTTNIIMCHTNEMSTVVQQFTLDDTLIPIPNDTHTPITEHHCISMSISSIDERFQKLEIKVCELNKSMNYELALFNKKWILFLDIWINLSRVTYQANKKSSKKKIYLF